MKIYLKNDNYNFKLFQKLAHRLGLFQVFTRAAENILLEIDYGYEVNQNKKVYYLYTEKFLFDLIDICAKLEIRLILENEENDNEMSKDLFFQMRESAHYNDIHKFETNQSVPAWIVEGFDSRQAWEQNNQFDADSDTSNDLDETHKYFNLQ